MTTRGSVSLVLSQRNILHVNRKVELLAASQNRSSWQRRGLKGSMVRGRTRWGGETRPIRPQTDKTPADAPCNMVVEMKSENWAQDLEFFNTMGGWRSESKLLPLKSPLKWVKNSSTSTPCLLYTSPSPRDLSTSRMPSSA